MLLQKYKTTALIYDGQYLLVSIDKNTPFVLTKLQRYKKPKLIINEIKHSETELDALARYVKSESFKTLKPYYKNKIKTVISEYLLTKKLDFLR